MDQSIASTAVARERQLPALRRNLAIEGLEDLTVEEDLILPRWRIVQYSSTIEGTPGQFNNNLTGELRDHLDLVVLKIAPSRARFDDERKLACMSRDSYWSTSGRSCPDCPYAQWGEGGEPPACSRGYTIICFDPEDDSLCLVGALRTSVPAVKRYNSLLAHLKRPPFGFLTRFTPESTVGPKGKYFVLGVELKGENDPDKVQEYQAQYRALAHVRIAEVEEPAYAVLEGAELEQAELPY